VAREANCCHSPRKSNSAPLMRWVVWAVAVSLVSGCATTDIDQLRTASFNAPTNAKTQLKYLNERDRQVTALLDDAERLRNAHEYDDAVDKLQQAWELDSTSERARRLAAAIELDRRDDVIIGEVERMMKRGSLDSAGERLDRVLADNPNNVAALRLFRELAEQRRLARLAADERNASACPPGGGAPCVEGDAYPCRVRRRLRTMGMANGVSVDGNRCRYTFGGPNEDKPESSGGRPGGGGGRRMCRAFPRIGP
jgi:hypothetical protein